MNKHGLFYRKAVFLFGFAAVFAAAMVPLGGCDIINDKLLDLKALSSIAITTPPAKIIYRINEKLDTTGMVVTATYTDGSTSRVRGYTTSPLDSSSVGQKTVTVSYKEGEVTKTATFTVTINLSGSSELPGTMIISGRAQVGETLTADTSGLGGTGPISYQWKRGDSAEAVNTVIPGATGATYTLTGEDVGKYIAVTVTRAGSGSKTSEPTGSTTGPGGISITPGVITEDDVAEVRVPLGDASYKLIKFMVSSSFIARYWFIDGVIMSDNLDNVERDSNGSLVLLILSNRYSAGDHSVTVIAEKDGNFYAITKTFAIQ